MKPGLTTTLYFIISNLAICLCFVPLIILWFKKLKYEKAYLVIALYWFANGLMNLPEWTGQSENRILIKQITLIYNLLDAPLVLIFFLYSSISINKKIIRYILGLFILFEIIMVAWKGYNLTSSTIIIGVGTFFAITFSVIGVMEYLQKMEHTPFENTMVFIYASLLFDYGIFIIIYFFSYLKYFFNYNNPASKAENIDNFIIYFVSLLLSTFLSCYGIWQFAGKAKEQHINSYS